MPNPIKFVRGVIRELIGRTLRTFRVQWYWNAPTRDLTKVDYAFWDKARRGKAQGLEVSGLLIKPVVSKIAGWTLGQQPTFVMESEPGQEAINDWWHENHADLLMGYEESLALGDAYVVVNPDLSVTIVPPDVVEPVVAEDDYSQMVGWKISERWPHPTEPGQEMVIEDTYTLQERIHTIRKGGVVVKEERYPNLIGIVPVVPVANNVGINQLYGVPEVEALAKMLHEYGEILDAALFGNKRQGRPTPTAEFKDVEALEAFFDTYGTPATQTLPDGTTEPYTKIPFSADEFMGIVGRLYYAQPGSFAGDTQTLLELLYLLYLEHTELPEFVLGSAISSSKASAESQMPVFEKFIDKKRGRAEKWMLQVVAIVQGYMSLGIEPGVVVEDVDIEWPRLTEDDGQLTLDSVKLALAEGLIDDETALVMMPLDIKNPSEVLEKARAEREAREQKRREDDLAMMMQRAIDDEEGADQVEDEDDEQTLERAA